jgi:type I restriction enzyme S subunit
VIFSIVPSSEITHSARWDAEFFQPYFRELGSRLRTTCKGIIADFVNLSDTAFDPSTVAEFNYAEISRVDPLCGQIETIKVKTSDTPDRAQTLLKGGEILVSTVRPNRSLVGLVSNGVKDWVATSGFAALLAVDKLHRSALFAWLKTKEMTDWLNRHTTASMYPAVSIPDVLNSPFPALSDSVLCRVHEGITEMEAILEKARRNYPEAEAELLDRISWQELSKKPCELYYTEDFETFIKRGRIDAEHYQPKYNRLLKQLKKVGSTSLDALLNSCDKGTQPDEYTDDGEVIVVKSKNVFGQGIELAACERTPLKVWADEPARLRENDVVINSTGLGTLGRAGVVHCDGQKIVASVDLLILRVKPKLIDPDYLSLFLNSPAGIAQSEQYQTGSSGQLHLYPQHIRQFMIYVPRNGNGRVDFTWQKRLADKVRTAACAKIEARAKLEEAKRLVERAIMRNDPNLN